VFVEKTLKSEITWREGEEVEVRLRVDPVPTFFLDGSGSGYILAADEDAVVEAAEYRD
jgi:hypothetical protein